MNPDQDTKVFYEQAQALVDRYADRRWQEECSLRATLELLFG